MHTDENGVIQFSYQVSSFTGITNVFKIWLQLPANLLPHKYIEILQLNDKPVIASRMDEVFLRNGFEQDG